ncbi:MAG: PIG-L deacetylase family protein [Acidimicrobiales bacterium]
MTAAPPGAGKVLVITAHPDDVDFGMAGTIGQWAEAGAEVTYCVVTDGDAGGFDPSFPRDQIGPLRQAEQRAAAEVLGVRDVRFLGYPDGRLEVSLALRRDLARVIRQLRPDRVLTQSPQRNFDRIFASHPDHLAVGEAALCAVYPDARNPFTFPELAAEGLEPHVVAEVWLAGGPEPDTFVDVTDQFERKLKALAAHASQVAHRDPAQFRELLLGFGAATAQRGGLPEGRLAEAFRTLGAG